MQLVQCTSTGQNGWLALRRQLWPEGSPDEHLAEMQVLLDQPGRFFQLVAYEDDRQPAGFVEAALRTDYVNGTDTSPVAFVEGIYVAPAFRRHGIGTLLVAAVVTWAKACACTELASDALLDNAASQAMHRALGFEETERVVFFRKLIP
ncbi:aminoglycoside 6'-N-acetyltransferase [Pseudoduganella albidiflava]|uniref:Aminoglycoside N(6')-acetyltransferase type 1 n=1 Tax=Pseudoduganella albidiflava TaxID=321983 RepID=A0A411X2J8_9BURK|nr:aminoglycoside 6'-N-acetyltransferase [Pseudoduganella albidiflava]QBI03220.1 GNAT family N-acetyltransferase [Pseudoduganella albidiflava]GGY64248.1 aminoglycoside N(6')-acetyltransferase type 1 [Pseudoduganella albidiflava]